MKFGNLKNEATGFLHQYEQQNPATYAAAQQAIGGLLILDGFVGIDNPLGGKKRPGIFGSLVGVVMGIVFIFIPTIFGTLTGVSKMTATTTATIVAVNPDQSASSSSSQGGSSCSAIATYSVGGQSYTRPSSIDSSGLCSLSAGQTTQINYNPNSPGQWSTDVKTIGLFMDIFSVAGVFIALASLVTFVIRLLSIIFGWKLLKSGRALAKTLPAGTDLTTVIREIEHSFKTSVFGFNPAPAGPLQAVMGQVLGGGANMPTASNSVSPAPVSAPPTASSPAPQVAPVTPMPAASSTETAGDIQPPQQ